MVRRWLTAPSAQVRVDAARRWLSARCAREPLCIVAPSLSASARLIHGLGAGHACFGWRRTTPAQLVDALALRSMASAGLAPARVIGERAVCARVVRELAEAGELGAWTRVAERPGLVDALHTTLRELRAFGVTPSQLQERCPELSHALRRYEEVCAEVSLADAAQRFELAARAARSGEGPLVGLPLLWFDVPLWEPREQALFEALAAATPQVLATFALGDEATQTCVMRVAGMAQEPAPAGPALAALHTGLFSTNSGALSTGEAARIDWLACAGEVRECVEIARRVRAEALATRRFDRMAVAVRNPDVYRAPLEEALFRAGVPAHFARGVARPEPAGRALLCLLRCARDGLSAQAFAEYLSLGQCPLGCDAPSDTPTELPPDMRGALSMYAESNVPSEAELTALARVASSRSVPRRWERWLVESAVVGGLERWERRLRGVLAQLDAEARAPGLDESGQARLRRRVREVESLRAFALPLLERLDALPLRANWGEWLAALEALVDASVRDTAAVRAVLDELAPLAPVGPVGLEEVLRVLEPRLGEALSPSVGLGAGKLYVGSIDDVLGMDFDLVFVPGLTEKGFPKKTLEDPLLLDAVRDQLGLGLVTTPERLSRERQRLRVCVGAANEALVASYPRLDSERGRPRVPSLYALEILRVRDGQALGFETLLRKASGGRAARLGWPAPAEPTHAIDEAEYDLAVLEQVLSRPAHETTGEGRYLLQSHAGLARALRFRARRWSVPRWTSADGLVLSPDDVTTRALLAQHRLAARPYSATALQQFAACPYRFYLHAVVGLRERPLGEPVEAMGAAERGAFFHAAQRQVLSELADAGALPLSESRLPEAFERLDHAIDALAARFRDELAPAIGHVFDDAVERMRTDLRQWLTLVARDMDTVPAYFELGFGLTATGELDRHSRSEPVDVFGAKLRGAIDLVERRVRVGEGAEVLRATDHKTGADIGPLRGVQGGRTLQPLLYALALEQLFPQATVEGGRLFFCTTHGGFESREVALDERTRSVAKQVLHSIDAALERGFLPAAPDTGACAQCRYRAVCGPYEEQRAAHKTDRAPLASLLAVRGLP